MALSKVEKKKVVKKAKARKTSPAKRNEKNGRAQPKPKPVKKAKAPAVTEPKGEIAEFLEYLDECEVDENDLETNEEFFGDIEDDISEDSTITDEK